MKLYWLVMPLFLMSCASADEGYPANWASLRDDVVCSGVFGVYENQGELANLGVAKNYKLDNYHPRLSDLLLQTPNDRIAAAKANFVEISQHDSVLYVRALQGSEVLVSAQYPQNLTRCKDGWLTVATDSGMAHGNGNVVLGYAENAKMLRSAADGSLVVRSTSKAAGLAFLMVPVAGNSTTYMRFQRQ